MHYRNHQGMEIMGPFEEIHGFSRYTHYYLQNRSSWGLPNCIMRFPILVAQHLNVATAPGQISLFARDMCNNSIGKFTVRAVEILILTVAHFYLKLNIHHISQPTQSMKSGKKGAIVIYQCALHPRNGSILISISKTGIQQFHSILKCEIVDWEVNKHNSDLTGASMHPR